MRHTFSVAATRFASSIVVITDLLVSIVRSVLRQWRQTLPIVIVACLSAGVAGAVGALVSSLLRNPLSLPSPDQVLTIDNALVTLKGDFARASDVLDYAPLIPDVEFATAYSQHDLIVNLQAAQLTQRARGAEVSGHFFETLGLSVTRGRAIATSDLDRGRNRVVVLSDELSKELHDGESLGQSILLNGISHDVIGIAPSGFRFPSGSRFWIPILVGEDRIGTGPAIAFAVVARFRPGVSNGGATTALRHFAINAERAAPGSWATRRELKVVPLAVAVLGDIGAAAEILTIALACLWLAAAVNLFTMLGVRAQTRHADTWVRLALGASPRQMAMHRIAEGAVTAVACFVGSAATAALCLRVVSRFMPADYGGVATLAPNTATLAIVSGASVLIGVVAALSGLRGIRTVASQGSLQLSHLRAPVGSRLLPVVVQAAVATVLLSGTAGTSSALWRLSRVDLGFDPSDAVVASISLPRASAPDDRYATVFATAIQEVRQLPGVEAVGATSSLPFGSMSDAIGLLFSIDGLKSPSAFRERFAFTTTVTTDYFRAMGIRLLEGRGFDARDAQGAPLVAVVSAALAKRYGGPGVVIGKKIELPGRAAQIVGVVGDVTHFAGSTDTAQQIFLPHTTTNPTFRLTTLTVRGATPAEEIVRTLRASLGTTGSGLVLSRLEPMSAIVARSRSGPIKALIIMATLSLAALALSAFSVFASLMQFVSQRRRELGVRMALGATTRHISALTMGRGAIAVLAGVVTGAVVSGVLIRTLSARAWMLPPVSLAEYGLVAVVLGVVALSAAWRPYLFATRIDLVSVRDPIQWTD